MLASGGLKSKETRCGRVATPALLTSMEVLGSFKASWGDYIQLTYSQAEGYRLSDSIEFFSRKNDLTLEQAKICLSVMEIEGCSKEQCFAVVKFVKKECARHHDISWDRHSFSEKERIIGADVAARLKGKRPVCVSKVEIWA